MNEKIDVLDRDARTLYDLACIRAKREDATREDVEAQAIALRLWTNLAAIAELIERERKLLAYIAAIKVQATEAPVCDTDRLRLVVMYCDDALANVGGGK